MMSGKTTLLCLCLLLVTLKTLVSARAETYRCISGLPCFPDTATLARFNQSLSGRLVVQRPIQASCYASDTLFDLSKCLEYTTNQLNLSFLADHSSSYEIPSCKKKFHQTEPHTNSIHFDLLIRGDLRAR